MNELTELKAAECVAVSGNLGATVTATLMG
jgi:hypothetical protein